MAEKFICSLCGKLAPDGLRIHGDLICRPCETRLVRLKVNDGEYGEWVSAIRSLWERWYEKAENPDS